VSTIDVTTQELWFAEPQAAETRGGVATFTHDAIAEVVLNRPAVLNALDLEMWRRVAEVFGSFAAQPGIRAVILRGAGGRAFSAGADIAEFRERRTGAAKASEYNAAIASVLTAVRDTPQPVVAMIDGLAVGGGCEIAAAADLRIASETSRFGIPVGRVGVTLGIAEASSLAALIGPGWTKRLVMSGELLDAGAALRIGLVEQVVSREALESETRRIAEAIAASAPTAARANKLVVNLLTYGPSPEGERTLQTLTRAVYQGDDLQEGIAAFLEKRSPRFEGVDDE
jgi:enoyl-CoA hydratase